jgi:exopolyphosphatase/guanosine-5'-triphosphate,3'-diphosphate pyrophosphatase
MKIASIDIGTNAVKSKIFKTTPTSIEFIEGIRSPIRLGTDVFTNGLLAKDKLDLLVKTLRKYQKNFIKNKISMYEIVATSAFRDTQNSEEARRYVENKIEHPIRIISGLEEAKLIRFHPKAQSRTSKVYVDVGGGSTEIYIYQNNKHIIQSFQLGAVRACYAKMILQNG